MIFNDKDQEFEKGIKKWNRPNIIIIVVDAFRPKNLSLFGYEKETDKNLKRVIKESILFKKFFSSSNATAPSLMSIFTGKYPNNHGIIHQFPYTSNEEIEKMDKELKFWLPTYLKEKGYETIAIDWIGLWFKEGFDYYKEKEEKQNKTKRIMNIPFIKKMLLSLPAWAYRFGKKISKTRASVNFTPAEETMNLAISKINISKKPFFLFTHFWDTHFPFPTIKYKGSKKDDVNEMLKKIKETSQREYVKKRIADINLSSIEDITKKYDSAIREVDKQIGKLFDFLRKQKLWENTLFIVLGDHGTSLTEHEVYFTSSSLYDETIHVPFIIHIPGVKNKEIKNFAQNIDIAPTILDILNETNSHEFDGKSMIELIRKGEKIRDKILAFDGLGEDIKTVRTDEKKLILAKNPRCNLCKAEHHEKIEEYNLKDDPNEEKNIYSGNSELMKFLE